MPGLWEFPGGKCEPGETPEEAAIRECLEETGLVVVSLGLREEIRHNYPHGPVHLSYFNAMTEDQKSEPDPASGFIWVEAKDLPTLEFPPANAPILDSLALQFGLNVE